MKLLSMMHNGGYKDGVWVVQEDSTPDFNVLAICASQEEALKYADSAQHHYTDGVIFSFYPFGYRHREPMVYRDGESS
ncbi:hypothetical protein GCM10009786_27520 [Leucobacter alluvii]|uniref:YCII-related domain-containing protein n=1 Tax=Leucobacter alluvii TaxID=340321 RepID=A0ABN3BAH9_9MICO